MIPPLFRLLEQISFLKQHECRNPILHTKGHPYAEVFPIATRPRFQLTPQGDNSQNHPQSVLGQVLDEHERHERGDEDEVSLLEREGSVPVDAHHAHHAKVPHRYSHRDPVHSDVVATQELPAGKGGGGVTSESR